MKYRRNTSENQKLKQYGHRNSVRAIPYSNLSHKNRRAFDSYTGIIYEGNQQVIPFYIMDSIEELFEADGYAIQKTILHMYFQKKLTTGEIAAILNMNKSNVATSIRRAIKRIKEKRPLEFKVCKWHFGEFDKTEGTESFNGSTLIRWESQNGVVEWPALGDRCKQLPEPRTIKKYELNKQFEG